MTARDAYHHGNLREALVEAAASLIESQGVEGLTLRGVARQAGVSAAAPYHHFKDKEALVAALCGQGFCLLDQVMHRAVAPHADPMDRLMAMGHAYVAFAAEHTPYFRIMWGRYVENKADYPELQGQATGAFDLLVATLAEAQSAGDVREADPLDLALATWATVHGMGRLVVDKGLQNPHMNGLGLDPERMLRASMDAVLRNLMPPERYGARRAAWMP